MLFICDMFDFDKVRFGSVHELSRDIQMLAQKYIALTLEALADDDVTLEEGLSTDAALVNGR